jgi:hypothetical protein
MFGTRHCFLCNRQKVDSLLKSATVSGMKDRLIAGNQTFQTNKRGSIASGVRVAARQRNAVESFRNAREAIGDLSPGMHTFALTRGQWSMIDGILATLDQTGPAHVSVWTWTVAEYEVQCVERLIMDKRLLSARLVIDLSGRSTNKGQFNALLNRWQVAFGADAIRYVVNHSKIARVWNDKWRCLLRGSMNLNFNPRFENFDISEGCAGFDLVTGVEDALPILPRDCSHEQAREASQVGSAFTMEQLSIFNPKKIWAK